MLQLFNTIQTILVPVCFVFAWLIIILTANSLWTAARDGIATAKQMHQIPCPDCSFFTNNHCLKCTVHPQIANTEEAINCLDYQPKTNTMFY
ncbi:MAG: hypothetical protein ACFB02_07260 [Mastigocoleus sp.]